MNQLQINWIEHYMKVQVRIAYALPACWHSRTFAVQRAVGVRSLPGASSDPCGWIGSPSGRLSPSRCTWGDHGPRVTASSCGHDGLHRELGSRHACVGKPRSNQNEWATQWGIKRARRWLRGRLADLSVRRTLCSNIRGHAGCRCSDHRRHCRCDL